MTERHFDVLLLQESSQYLDTLYLFQRAWSLLKEGGQVLLVDEFGLERDTDDPDGALPMLAHVIRQAQQTGFALQEELNLSQAAAPTVDYLLAKIEQYQARLLADLPVDKAMLGELSAALEKYRQRYAQGRYGYALLHFRKQARPQWTLYPLENETHLMATRATLERSFSNVADSEVWQWRYGEGRGLAVNAQEAEKSQAFCGMNQRAASYQGKPIQILQLQDWCGNRTDSDTQKCALFQACATLLERWSGYARPYPLSLARFDGECLARIEQQGVYAKNTRLFALRLPAQAERPHLRSRLRVFDPERDGAAVDRLWQAMRLDLALALVGVRDWNYIHWRYIAEPQRPAQLFLLSKRFTDTPMALLAVQEIAAGTYELLDYVGELAYLGLALRHGKRLVARLGGQQLLFRFSADFLSQVAVGGKPEALDEWLALSCWNPGPVAGSLNCWLSGGDLPLIVAHEALQTLD